MSVRHVYKDLDAPVPILFMDPTAFILAIMAMGVGIVAKAPFLGVLLMGIVIYMSRALQRGAKKNQAKHLFWRMGFEFADGVFKKKKISPLQLDFAE